MFKGFSEERDFSHEEVFGHLVNDEFTSAEAAEYLEVSTSTFRRYLKKEQLTPSSSVDSALSVCHEGLRRGDVCCMANTD